MAREPGIIRRLVLTADVELASPLLIGTGQNDNLTDTLVLKDKEGYPFIPGSSIAGVLRSLTAESPLYFGNLHMDKASKQYEESQSTFIFSDITLDSKTTVVRDSVRIDEATNVAADKGKFDYEVVERGAKGKLKIVANIRKWQSGQAEAIKETLREIGQRVQDGLAIGADTRKGFGKVVGTNVILDDYDYKDIANVKAYLLGKSAVVSEKVAKGKAYLSPETFVLEAELSLRTSLLVRDAEFDLADYSAITKEGDKINAVQMKSKGEYVIPGASVKGVIHRQARKIMAALGKDEGNLADLFGYSLNDKSKKGRVVTEEIYFREGVKDFKQTRNKIDRFTNATVDSALFTNIPVTQISIAPALHLRLYVEQCAQWEAGLMLLILKDIWTGMVAFGGEKSIGRGTMEGCEATITYKGATYGISQVGDNLKLTGEGAQAALESFVTALGSL